MSPHDKTLQDTAGLLDKIIISAQEADPKVLSTIYNFHQSMIDLNVGNKSSHNHEAQDVTKYKTATLISLANSLERHRELDAVNPSFMPYQYRK